MIKNTGLKDALIFPAILLVIALIGLIIYLAQGWPL
jgi:hypothetical protein